MPDWKTAGRLDGERLEKKSVLLVEDDSVVRDMIRGTLEREYGVLEASKCSEAVSHLKNPIDLALLDYDLPDGDGFEVLKAIRELNQAIPVILITAYGHEELVIKAFRSGVVDYIKKPICFKYLLGKVSEILRGSRFTEEPLTLEKRDEFVMDGVALYIKEHYMRELTREKITRMTQMNRNKFTRAFKDRFGISFKTYLRDVRVENAARLLKNPDLSIQEISNLVGYESVTHFERVFKEECGMSPRKYRNRLKRQDEETSLQS
ncbi:MAG: response regulator transcription factor [Nitrospirae bacterium]|nr:response regulator transcription factor [Nitrospirota bacterium]MCL5421735.1 response regulator transcription factor [Nitrospirota bacterium]